MASELDHIALANRNHRTLVYLARSVDEHVEWVATIAFYKAVQIVEAVLAVNGQHSHGHDDRFSNLRLSRYADIFKAYRPLYAASMVARYLVDSSNRKLEPGGPVNTYRTFSDYRSSESVIRNLVNRRLKTVEEHSVKFLSDEAKSSLVRVSASDFEH